MQALGELVEPRRAGRKRHRLMVELGVVADQAGHESDQEADPEPEPDPRSDGGAAQA
jgi:hypothetical protein